VKDLEPILGLLQTSRHKFVVSANEVPAEVWGKSPVQNAGRPPR
jgi:hypothetical protein